MQTKPFQKHVRKALANPALQAALDYNSEKRKTAFDEAFHNLPQADLHRERARAARQMVSMSIEHPIPRKLSIW